MKTQTQLLIALTALLFSCGKKFECEGTVYSRHHVPMPNEPVLIPYMTGGKDQTADYYSAKTDENGHFVFNQRLRAHLTIKDFLVQNIDSGNGGVSNIPTSVNGKKDLEINLK